MSAGVMDFYFATRLAFVDRPEVRVRTMWREDRPMLAVGVYDDAYVVWGDVSRETIVRREPFAADTFAYRIRKEWDRARPRGGSRATPKEAGS